MNKKTLSILLLLIVFTAVFLYARSNNGSNSLQNQTDSTTREEEMLATPNSESNTSKGNTIEPSQENGEIQATGTFNLYALGIAPDTLCIKIDGRNNFFCFENQAEAKAMLDVSSAGKLGEGNCDEISGRATITYNNFKEGYYNNGGGSIKLLSVDKIIEPAKCGRLS